ncbi:MAG: hypothetical protein QOD03_1438 [Verrucomicrobiota bacterium]|jgi:hypothetical protein
MRMNRAFILLLPLLVTGCLHTVKYKLTEADRWNGPKIDAVLLVQPITDKTTYTTNDWKPKTVEGETWRTNPRGGYSHTNLTKDVTAMVAKHLAYSGLFSKVVTDKTAVGDYVLSGKLTAFKTSAQVNSKAETIAGVSSAFGLIGAVVGSTATAQMKAEVKTWVTLDELRVNDKSGQIRWQESIHIAKDETMNFREADSFVLYKHPDAALKEAVTDLIRRLGTSSLTNRVAL